VLTWRPAKVAGEFLEWYHCWEEGLIMKKLLGLLLCLSMVFVLGFGSTGCTKPKKKEETPKIQPKKEEPKKKIEEPKKEEPKKEEPKKEEPKKEEPKKEEPKKEEPKKEVKKDEPKKDEPKKNDKKEDSQSSLRPTRLAQFREVVVLSVRTSRGLLE
jgi:LAS superfamily LD-carboxypeptidase LdcB